MATARARRRIVFAACAPDEFESLIARTQSLAAGEPITVVCFDDIQQGRTLPVNVRMIGGGLPASRAAALWASSLVAPFDVVGVFAGRLTDASSRAGLISFAGSLRSRNRVGYHAEGSTLPMPPPSWAARGRLLTSPVISAISRLRSRPERRSPSRHKWLHAVARVVTRIGLLVTPSTSAKAWRPPGQRVAVLVPVLPDLSHTFVYREVLALKQRHPDWVILALERGDGAVLHAEAQQLLPDAVFTTQPSPEDYLRLYLRMWLTRPRRMARLIRRFRHQSQSFAITAPADDRFVFLDLKQIDHTAHVIKGLILAEHLRQLGIGYIHAYGFTYPSVRALVAHDLLGIPFSISTFVDFDYASAFRMPDDKLNSATFVVGCTAFCSRRLAQLADSSSTIHTLHHALPAGYANGPRFRAPGGPPRLVFVGRFVAKKGLNTLIEACAILSARGVEFSCHLYGDGEERAAIAALTATLGVTQVVHLEGPIPNQAFYSTMSPADVFVCPCRYRPDGERDGIPVTLLEAMAAGIAVVSTTVSGIPELIEDQVNGFLVPPENATALADVLQRLLTNDGLRRSISISAMETIRDRFSLDGTVPKLDEWISRETQIAFAVGAPVSRRPPGGG